MTPLEEAALDFLDALTPQQQEAIPQFLDTHQLNLFSELLAEVVAKREGGASTTREKNNRRQTELMFEIQQIIAKKQKLLDDSDAFHQELRAKVFTLLPEVLDRFFSVRGKNFQPRPDGQGI